MVRISFITFDGREQAIDASTGISLMENAVANGVEGIDAVCGGNAYCGTCRVYVDPAWQDRLGTMNEIERPMIETAGDDNPAVRLSCQIQVSGDFDGLVVRLPEKQT